MIKKMGTALVFLLMFLATMYSALAVCIETDAGSDFYNYGKTGTSYGAWEDKCSIYIVGALEEYSCNDDGTASSETFICPNGCKDGACISGGSITGVDIDIYGVSAPKYDIEVGNGFYVTGYAKVTKGTCTGCVVETTLNPQNGAFKVSLSTIEKSSNYKGACGDDSSTGVKFNAKQGDIIRFKLKVNALSSGKWKMPIEAYNMCCNEGDCSQLDSDSVTVDIIPKIVDTPTPSPSATPKPSVTPTPSLIDCYYCSGNDLKSVQSEACITGTFQVPPECGSPEVIDEIDETCKNDSELCFTDVEPWYIRFWNWLIGLFK